MLEIDLVRNGREIEKGDDSMGFYAVTDSDRYVILAETPIGNYALKEKNVKFLKEKHGIDLYDFVDMSATKTINITETSITVVKN